ncbi:receptor activity-modifying protein 2 isoform X2 [Dendropsophus ebraccatus]
MENVTQPAITMANFSLTTTNVSHPAFDPVHLFANTYEGDAEKCWFLFSVAMLHLKHEHWCNWKRTVRIYSYLQDCLETRAENRSIAFPNELAHSIILEAHLLYFVNCSLLSEELMDPPENILLGLILTPICLIPVLVTIVVYKSNASKPQT